MFKRQFAALPSSLFLTAALGCGGSAARAANQDFQCFPTCSEVDGKMLSLAGAGLFTLGGDSIEIRLISPGGGFQLGIFDGDTGAGDPPHWDRVPPEELGETQLRYRLLADPAGDGSREFEVGPPGGWNSNASNPSRGIHYVSRAGGAETGVMPDNAWFEIDLTDAPEAQAEPGSACPPTHYCYRLRVTHGHSSGATESNFKLRSSAQILLEPRAFSVVGGLRSLADARVIYPRLDQGDLSPTRYDGRWQFDFVLGQPARSLSIWDGDFDFGSWDCQDADSDDPDTCENAGSQCVPNHHPEFWSEIVPPWAAGTAARSEGVAIGTTGIACRPTGAPPDDADPASLVPLVPPCAVAPDGQIQHCFSTRRPSVRYRVESPTGVFVNANPSGNQEWEQFRLDTDPSQPADFHVDTIPAGAYRLTVEGLDPANLSALRFPQPVLGVVSASLGGRVWLDADGNAREDPGEPGIERVQLLLFRDTDADGRLSPGWDQQLTATVSGADGRFLFSGLGGGRFFVDVTESTLPAGLVLTTGNEPYNLPLGPYQLKESEQHRGADFGYFPAHPPGVGTPGFWRNHPSAWPVPEIWMGGSRYRRDDALRLMSAEKRKDKSYDLFRHLAASRLNAAAGNDWSCVAAAMSAADSWLIRHPPGSQVAARSAAWQQSGEALKDALDAYNNGRLPCARHRD